jgi:hypothetical protein
MAFKRVLVDVDGLATVIGPPSLSLVREVVRFRHDVLVRSHARDLVAPPELHDVDVQLSRLCPCPLWTARRSAPNSTAKITPLRIDTMIAADKSGATTPTLVRVR